MVTTIKIHGEVTYGSWPDCEGSTGTSYYSLHERGEVLAREDFHQLRAVLNLGLISPSIPLVSQIRPILRLFGAGNYSVKILHKVIFHGFHRPNPECTNYYPHNLVYYGEQLYLTDKFPSMEEEREPEDGQPRRRGMRKELVFPVGDAGRHGMDQNQVAFYENQIKKGRRPLCLVLADTPYTPSTLDSFKRRHLPLSCSWLLDGHHKLLAYANLDILPSVLRMEFMNNEKLTIEDHIALLGALECAQEAVRVMSRYGRRVGKWAREQTWDDYELSEDDEREIRELLITQRGKMETRHWFRDGVELQK
jgi:hypothetical protein